MKALEQISLWRLRLLAVVALGAIFGAGDCVVLKNITDPLGGLVQRRSCIAIDLPPITLTPERTAAERQLVGENKEIEKSGWLIASAQSGIRYNRNRGQRSAQLTEQIRRLFRERAVLEFFQEAVNDYRNRELLGEARNGELRPLPANIARRGSRRFNAAEYKKAEMVAAEVNLSRKWIYNYYLEQEKKKKQPDLKQIKKQYLEFYLLRASRGIWVQDKNGRWTKKR